MEKIIEKLGEYGVVPVVVINDKVDADPLADALCEGGLACAEVTFRTEAAEEAIRIMKNAHPEMLVGAGTVLTIDQVDRAVNAGAGFIVSPGYDPEIVDYCIERKIPVIPGCVTPSEVAKGISRGLEVLKFFPCEQAGGLPMLKAMSGPYTNVKFMPTGGISAENLADYLSFSKIVCCGGSWMVKSDLIKAKDFETIKAKVREAVEIVRNARSEKIERLNKAG